MFAGFNSSCFTRQLSVSNMYVVCCRYLHIVQGCLLFASTLQ